MPHHSPGLEAAPARLIGASSTWRSTRSLEDPLAVMTADPSKYRPISCDFHDLLEALATTHKLAEISFLDGEGAVQRRSAAIADVFARDGSEYLSISTGETLRLDQLLAVDDAKLADC